MQPCNSRRRIDHAVYAMRCRVLELICRCAWRQLLNMECFGWKKVHWVTKALFGCSLVYLIAGIPLTVLFHDKPWMLGLSSFCSAFLALGWAARGVTATVIPNWQ